MFNLPVLIAFYLISSAFSVCRIDSLCISPDNNDNNDKTATNKQNNKHSNERKLVECLLDDYNSNVRPVRNHNETLQVYWDHSLIKIIDIDKNHVLTVDLYFKLSWDDVYLKWSPNEYGEILMMNMTGNHFWRPTLDVVNNAGASLTTTDLDNRLVTITHMGRVHWSHHLRIHVNTHVDYTYFPYDVQRFAILIHNQFPSVVMRFDDVEVGTKGVLYGGDLRFMDQNVEWRVVNLDLVLAYHMDNKLKVEYDLQMKRDSKLFSYFYIYPVVVVGLLMLSLLFIPHDGGLRFVVALLTLICLLLMTNEIRKVIPSNTTHMPRLVLVLVYEMVLFLIIFFISCLTQALHIRSLNNKSSNNIPDVIKKIFFNKFTRYICCNFDDWDNSTSFQRHLFLNEEEFNNNSIEFNQLERDTSTSSEDYKNSQEEIKILIKKLQTISKSFKSFFNCLNLNDDWRRLALIIDRLSLLFLSFVSLIVISSICK